MAQERLEFEGPSGKAGYGLAAAQVSLSPAELWVYVQVKEGVLQVYSELPCRGCRRRGTRWLRCKLHRRCQIIAYQLDLI